ncbi:hypothetical protein CRUP_006309 [Coryphaenoides rupestris]|nr:hypothetical protein CRUP_006309 [Coryphaenoides rupestris]
MYLSGRGASLQSRGGVQARPTATPGGRGASLQRRRSGAADSDPRWPRRVPAEAEVRSARQRPPGGPRRVPAEAEVRSGRQRPPVAEARPCRGGGQERPSATPGGRGASLQRRRRSCCLRKQQVDPDTCRGADVTCGRRVVHLASDATLLQKKKKKRMILRKIKSRLCSRTVLTRVAARRELSSSSGPVPPQPVPPLERTLQDYLRALEPLLPPDEFQHTQNKRDFCDWRGQLVFASKLIAAVLDFKSKVDTCRIPGPKHDYISQHALSRRSPTHITVVRNYQFFQLEVYNSDGSRMTESQIHGQLLRIRSASWKTDKEPMGILTSEHRHTWGQAYKRLLRGTPAAWQPSQKPDPKRAPLVPLPMPRKLYFYIDPDIKRDIEHAKQNLDILINDLDVNVFNFRQFGKELPKQHGFSPNAFIQVALQLSYYRVHGEVSPACDIASLRMFRGGRTEFIRSPTRQTLDFILAFDDPGVSREAKLQLFREAVEVYSALTDRAMRGQGLDRHLLGLKLQAIEEGLSIPKVPANTDSVMCFGPLVPDGYAVCYNPQADHVHFSVTAFNCCAETDAETLARTLKLTLGQLHDLLLQPSSAAAAVAV